jgi:hypothetical protein
MNAARRFNGNHENPDAESAGASQRLHHHKEGTPGHLAD